MDIFSYLLGKSQGGGGGSVNLQEKSETITTNTETTITPDNGYDGLSSVAITTNVQPNLQSKSETITTNTTTTITADNGYDGLSSVSVTTNVSGSGVPDWSQIGYSSTPQSIIDDFNYAKNILDTWDSSITSMYYKYNSNRSLVYYPLVNVSNVTDMGSCFYGCSRLAKVPALNTSNVTSFNSTFYGCASLYDIEVLNTSSATNLNNMFKNSTAFSDTSLDNILQMCIGATSYTGTKTLAQLGITDNTLKNKVPTLPHYQDFLDAGWTIS